MGSESESFGRSASYGAWSLRHAAPVYGSGGFTTYNEKQMRRQLSGWAEGGIPRVKIKVGTHPEQDMERVRLARVAIGADAELFVDANGAYSRKQALYFAKCFAEETRVTWFACASGHIHQGHSARLMVLAN